MKFPISVSYQEIGIQRAKQGNLRPYNLDGVDAFSTLFVTKMNELLEGSSSARVRPMRVSQITPGGCTYVDELRHVVILNLRILKRCVSTRMHHTL